LGMWVKGVEQDGDVPADQRGYFLVNSLFLKRTLWQPYRQIPLDNHRTTQPGKQPRRIHRTPQFSDISTFPTTVFHENRDNITPRAILPFS